MVYKIVRDTVHGNIKVEKLFLDLIETPEIQKLSGIHQLGFAYLVYPGANHTRLEHSLGALHVAGRIAKKLGLQEFEKNLVMAAALLHDVGHGPYSHTLEYLMSRILGLDHLEITKEIIVGEYDVIGADEKILFRKRKTIPEILEKYGLEPNRVADLIVKRPAKKSYLSQIIHSEVDADQIDYLLRDAHYTGVAYGIIDIDRLIETLRIYKDELVVDRRGVSAVENMLVARGLMYSSVYFHKTVRIAQLMMARAVEKALEQGALDVIRMIDSELLTKLKQMQGFPREIALMLKYRKLFKKVYSLSIKELNKDKKKKATIKKLTDNRERKQKEAQLCARADIPEGHVILDIPLPEIMLSEPRLDKVSVKILDQQEIKPLSAYSPLADALRTRPVIDWAVMVSADPRYRKKVSSIVEKVLFE